MPYRFLVGSVTIAVGFAPPAGAQGRQAAAAARMADSTVFEGRVVRQSDALPIAGADVWLLSLDRHATTDSTGAFRFTRLAPGALLVQVRRLGYAVQRDTVTVIAGRAVNRTYAMMDRATQLDTVTSTAGKEKYLSPSLRAFENRRLSHAGGYFVSDSEFRLNESSTMANIIESRIPGLTASYLRSAKVLVSTRKKCKGIVFGGGSCASSAPNCYVAIYVDGVLYFNARMADEGVLPPDMDKEFNPMNFAGAEYYAGGASAPIGMHDDDDGCGSLWLWTRER